jgi:hypothetical protein
MPNNTQKAQGGDVPEAATKTEASRALLTIFSSPRVGLIGTLLGTLLGVVGILLSIYVYRESREYPELTYYVHPVKASVLKSGKASKLQCDFEGQPITSDITVAQVAIWNQGKRSIKRNNILKPVVLYATNAAPILQATLRKQSRDVVNLEIDRKELQSGKLMVSWAILEQNDGAVIQLTYAGGPDVAIVLDGVVEGQGNVQRVDYTGRLPTPEEQYRSRVSSDRTFRWIMLAMGSFAIISSLWMLRRSNKSDRFGVVLNLMMLLLGCATLILFVALRYLSMPPGPPFGFD